jgi:DeoR family fructose operon transcriptional repressor
MKPAQDRSQAILELVAAKGRVSIADLTRQLKVSETAIRRDLAALDVEGAIRRVHGGALPVPSGSYEAPFAARAKLNVDAKRNIASEVATRIGDGETAALGEFH